MKVLHVSNYFPGLHHHLGGAEQACYRAALLAARHSWQVGLATTRPEIEATAAFPVDRLPILEEYLPEAVRPYLEAVKWYALQYDPMAYHRFQRLLDRERPQVVHFHNCQFLTLSLLSAAKQAGCTICMSIYDYWLFCPTVMLLTPNQQFCRRGHGPWCLPCLPSM